MKKILSLTLLILTMTLSLSCGYSTKSALPARFRTVYIEDFKNKISFTTEQARNIYIPLLEVTVRDAVVDRFLFDGNLRIAKPETADLVLKGELVQYQRDALRYTDDDDVEEYRVQIIVNLILLDTKLGEPLWTENGFGGEATYFVSGPLAGTEENAVQEATVDLAKRIVERAIENW
jgi:hypothetical protein